MTSERDILEKLSVVSNIRMSSQKQQEIWNNIQQEISQTKVIQTKKNKLKRYSNIFAGGSAVVAAIAIVAGLYTFKGNTVSNQFGGVPKSKTANETSNTTAQTPLSSSSNDTNASNGTNSSAPSNGSNSSTTNQTTNNTAPTSSPKTDGLQFANYVAQAMGQVKQATKVPFLFAPTEPTFHPDAQFIGVKEFASNWDYNVRLFSTPTSVPLNDSSLNQLPASSFVGMFGGTYYSSHDQAMNNLNTEFHVIKVQNAGTIDGFMKQYTTGKTYNTGDPTNYEFPQNVIEWREGKWTIDVFGAPSLDFINEAKQVNTFLLSHALPPTDGRILINPNLTGNPVTQIGWVFGNTLYECEFPSMTMAQILNALQMAVSMREYDSYRVTP
ncbi:hypothetical protein [Alicyclobacillus pomorum]|uniref:hypothetical protein n=1 Tax=Alicyclobacillus pomorum TaxID=204470 RepID=UPI0004178DED|nr:hypothetical protein [Alicyclobacillus pomorum]